MLNEEKQADDALRQQFKEKWSRTPSEKLTEMFKSNSAKYRQIINNAIQADGVVREKFEKHRRCIELLSKSPDELQNAVPRGSTGGNVSNASAAETLRQLMEEVCICFVLFWLLHCLRFVFQVETIKAERDVIESELKSATLDMKDTFLQALGKDGAINEPAVSVETLGQTFGPLQKQVKESLERQGDLVERIKV